MKRLFLLLSAALPLLAAAQFQSFPVSGPVPEQAVCYTLPATCLDLEITVKTVTEAPGEYARYAERYIGVKEVITTASVSKEIVCVGIKSHAVADPLQRYYLMAASLSSKVTPKLPEVTLTEAGVLLGLNASPAEKMAAGPMPCRPMECDLPGAFGSEPGAMETCCTRPAPVRTLTSEMLHASSGLKMAELAAKQIFSLRETRLALLQGEVENMPKDGEGLKCLLAELDRTEQAYMELFTGTRRETVETVRLSYVPRHIGESETAFRFSTQKGVVSLTDLSGSPVTLIAKPAEGQLPVQEAETLPNPDRRSEITSLEVPAGVYYYLPQTCSIDISLNHQVLCHREMELAQAGQLMKLPAEANLKAGFSPCNGALVSRSVVPATGR